MIQAIVWKPWLHFPCWAIVIYKDVDESRLAVWVCPLYSWKLPLSMITSQTLPWVVHWVWKMLCLSQGSSCTGTMCTLHLTTNDSPWSAGMPLSYTSFAVSSSGSSSKISFTSPLMRVTTFRLGQFEAMCLKPWHLKHFIDVLECMGGRVLVSLVGLDGVLFAVFGVLRV